MATNRRSEVVVEEEDLLLTFKEAEDFLRVSRATLYRLLGSGQLVGHKVGRSWRFYRSDLRRFISESVPAVKASQPKKIQGQL
jgi:excisionase family DNA binding protein